MITGTGGDDTMKESGTNIAQSVQTKNNQPLRTTRDLKEPNRTVALLEGMFNELYLVGGAVRDALIGVNTCDLDFAVPYEPSEVIRILKANHMPVYEVGLEYNTVGTAASGFDIQITTYRSDAYDDVTRKPEVETIQDIYSDLDRRDFTINAMALSKTGFVDPHNGMDDLKDKTICSVLNAEMKFKEDPLRILRAYRLVSVYGFNIEEKTLIAAKKMKNELLRLPTERVGTELLKLMGGDCWSDAVFELIESGILNVCLERFGMTSHVVTDNAFSVFDKFSSEELKSMQADGRWALLVEIVYDAEKNSGTSTLDILLTAEHLTLKASLPKAIRNSIKSLLSNEQSAIVVAANPATPDNVAARSHIPRTEIESKWSKIRELKTYGKEAYFTEHQYGPAGRHFHAAINILDDLYGTAITSIADEELKKSTMRRLLYSYIDFLGFEVAAHIMQNRLFAMYDSTEMLEKRLKKEIASGRLNKHDYRLALHEGIAHMYRENPRDSKLESFEAFIAREDNQLSDEKKVYLLRSYLAYCIRNVADTPKEKMHYNKRLARLIEKQAGGGDLGLDYYDPWVDYWYNNVLSSKSIDDYTERYDRFVDVTSTYLSVAEKEGKTWYAQKRAHLNAASCNAHALRLAESVPQKKYYATCIVENYTDAGHRYKKNADRYRVYEDWFMFAWWLRELPIKDMSLSVIHDQINGYPSYEYVDPDEVYFTSQLVDIAEIRDLLADIHKFSRTTSVKGIQLKDDVIDAIKTLLLQKIVSEREALMALRNYVSLRSKDTIDTQEFQIEDIADTKRKENEIDALLADVESKNLEFKASWRFDVDNSLPSQAKGSADIGAKIAQTITAFMNTDGGTILIGVRNNKDVCGLEETDAKLYTKSKNIDDVVDKIKLDLDDVFEHKIGQAFQDYKEVLMHKYKGKTVLLVKVRKVETVSPVKFEDDIYIRGEGGNRALSAGQAASYMEQRFSIYGKTG